MKKYLAGDKSVDATQFTHGKMIRGAIVGPDRATYVNTRKGKCRLSVGDYVFTGNNGIEVMSQAEFEAKFTQVVVKLERKEVVDTPKEVVDTPKAEKPAKKAAKKKATKK